MNSKQTLQEAAPTLSDLEIPTTNRRGTEKRKALCLFVVNSFTRWGDKTKSSRCVFFCFVIIGIRGIADGGNKKKEIRNIKQPGEMGITASLMLQEERTPLGHLLPETTRTKALESTKSAGRKSSAERMIPAIG